MRPAHQAARTAHIANAALRATQVRWNNVTARIES